MEKLAKILALAHSDGLTAIKDLWDELGLTEMNLKENLKDTHFLEHGEGTWIGCILRLSTNCLPHRMNPSNLSLA